jgi:hypothetical protein
LILVCISSNEPVFSPILASIIIANFILRHGWADTSKAMRRRGDDKLLDPIMSTNFDEREWQGNGDRTGSPRRCFSNKFGHHSRRQNQ